MDFKTKAEIAAECWMATRKHESWKELLSYGDIGFPLAYSVTEGLATVTPLGKNYIEEIYDLILQTLQLEEDDGPFVDFESMLDANIAKYSNEEDDDDAEQSTG